MEYTGRAVWVSVSGKRESEDAGDRRSQGVVGSFTRERNEKDILRRELTLIEIERSFVWREVWNPNLPSAHPGLHIYY
jgi:hypothetical protein